MDPNEAAHIVYAAATRFLSDNKGLKEPQALVLAAKQYLSDREFHLCRVAAAGAKSLERENSAVPQILAVVDIIIAGETPLAENLFDWYAILGVPRYSNDLTAILDQYNKLRFLLDGNETLPGDDGVQFAGEALNIIKKAWYEISDETRKSEYDEKLRIFEEEESIGANLSGSKSQVTNIQESSKANVPIIKSRFSGEIRSIEEQMFLRKRAKPKIVIWSNCRFCKKGSPRNHVSCSECKNRLRAMAVEALQSGTYSKELLLDDAFGIPVIQKESTKKLKTEEIEAAGEVVLWRLVLENNPRRLLKLKYYDQIVERFYLGVEGLLTCPLCTHTYQYNLGDVYRLRCWNEECQEVFRAQDAIEYKMLTMSVSPKLPTFEGEASEEDDDADNGNDNGDGSDKGAGQFLLKLAKFFLSHRNFKDFREVVLEAIELDPRNPAVPRIIAVLDTLIAAKTPITETQPDWYGILRVPRYSDDFLEIKDQYKKLCLLLDPNEIPGEELPLTREAFRHVNDAWYELSVKSRKSQYDKKLKFFEEESRGANRSGSKSQLTRSSNIQESTEASSPKSQTRSIQQSNSKCVAALCEFCTINESGGNHVSCSNCKDLLRILAVKALESGKNLKELLLNDAAGIPVIRNDDGTKELKTEEIVPEKEYKWRLVLEKTSLLLKLKYYDEIVEKFYIDDDDDDEDDPGNLKV